MNFGQILRIMFRTGEWSEFDVALKNDRVWNEVQRKRITLLFHEMF
jgi:hypothetical protein